VHGAARTAVVGAVVVHAFAQHQQERIDPAVLLDHAMQGRLCMQVRQSRVIERTEYADERFVEREDGGEIGGDRVAKRHRRGLVFKPGFPESARTGR
jgi:hypothetical protein